MTKGEKTDNEKMMGCERERASIKPRELLPKIIEEITQHYQSPECFHHIEAAVLPSRETTREIIEKLKEVLFPGYFGHQELNRSNLIYHTGTVINQIFEKLSHQISRSLVHECRLSHEICSFCLERGQEEAVRFLRKIPALRTILAKDVRAAYDGDPAAKSFDEVIFSYPGLLAVSVYRIAHELYLQEIPLLSRIMTEYAHSITGIDIHPGAETGESFFIDHGTGVVIGETTIIGHRVKIYQGVTLGAANFPRDEQGNLIRGMKRHPTIEDDVTIYSGATILGGCTVIGARSVIGGNVWVTESVPPDTTVINEKPDLIYKGKGR